jgi:hypothetical protein
MTSAVELSIAQTQHGLPGSSMHSGRPEAEPVCPAMTEEGLPQGDYLFRFFLPKAATTSFS